MAYSHSRIVCLIVCAVLIAASAGAYAAVVRVTSHNGPVNTGWLYVRYRPGSYDTKTTGGLTQIEPKGFPSPRPLACFHGKCAYSGAEQGQLPGQVWFGTDQFSGTPIASISKLEYSTFMYMRGGSELSPDDVFYASQPFQLQLVIKDAAGNYHYLMHRPWGMTPQFPHGPPDGRYSMIWQTHDAASAGSVWYEPWYDSIRSWPEIVAAYPGATLATPANSGDPWATLNSANMSTRTGACLNFVLGALAQGWQPFGASDAWWRESLNGMGAMDNFTISIDGAETTHDFDVASPFHLDRDGNPTGPIPVYTMNNVAITDKYRIWYVPVAGDPSWMTYSIANRNSALAVIYGRVIQVDEVDPTRFQIDDGAGKIIPVRAPDAGGIALGQYVRCFGSLSAPFTYWGLITPGRPGGDWLVYPSTFCCYGPESVTILDFGFGF